MSHWVDHNPASSSSGDCGASVKNLHEFQEPETLQFTRGNHLFEIRQWHTENGRGYVGFFDGQISVAAQERHVVARLLLLRHSR